MARPKKTRSSTTTKKRTTKRRASAPRRGRTQKPERAEEVPRPLTIFAPSPDDRALTEEEAIAAEVHDAIPVASADGRWHVVKRAMGWFVEQGASEEGGDSRYVQIGLIGRTRWTVAGRLPRGPVTVIGFKARGEASIICDVLNFGTIDARKL